MEPLHPAVNVVICDARDRGYVLVVEADEAEAQQQFVVVFQLVAFRHDVLHDVTEVLVNNIDDVAQRRQ